MMRGVRTIAVLGIALVLSSAPGCTYTVAGPTPPPVEPPAATCPPRVEYGSGDVTFAWGSGKPTSSEIDTRLLSDDLVRAWKQRGYIVDAQFVPEGSFSGHADYNVTLSGSQRNETSFSMLVLHALTLTLAPYWVTRHYDLQVTLEDVATAQRYGACVQGEDKTYVETLLLLALPFAHRGHRATAQRMGDHLYEQFHRQGAFRCTSEAPAAMSRSAADACAR